MTLKQILKEAKMSVNSLAEQLGKSRVYISRVLNNRICPSFEVAINLCKILNLDLNKFKEINYDGNRK